MGAAAVWRGHGTQDAHDPVLVAPRARTARYASEEVPLPLQRHSEGDCCDAQVEAERLALTTLAN